MKSHDAMIEVKNDFIKMFTGSGVAHIILIFSMPIVTRLFSPDEFGVAAYFISVSSLLGIFSCLLYEQAIILPKNNGSAANILVASILILFLLTALISIVINLFDHVVIGKGFINKLYVYIHLVPLSFLLQGVRLSLSGWSIRMGYFDALSHAALVNQLVLSLIAVGGGYLGYSSAYTIILSWILGQIISIFILAWSVWREDGYFIVGALRWKLMYICLHRYRRFAMISPWAALLNSASLTAPLLVVGYYFSSIIAGFYALSLKVIQVPMSMIGNPLRTVFMHHAANLKRTDQLGNLVEEIFYRLLSIAIVPCAVIMVVGMDFFGFVFGQEWKDAGIYAQILTPWAFVWFLSSTMGGVFYIFELQKEDVARQFMIFATRILSVVVGSVFDSPALAMLLFSSSGILVYGHLLARIIIISGARMQVISGVIKRSLIDVLIYVLPLLLVKYFSDNVSYILLVSMVSVSIYIYVNYNIYSNMIHAHVAILKK